VKWNLERKVQKKQPLFDLLPPIKSIDTVDDLTVRVTFGRPSFNVKATLSAKTFSMLSPTLVQKVGDDGLKQQASGTGPFTVTEFRPLEVLRLRRNPNYWQKDLPYLNEVVFRVVPDVNTRATMLEAGDVDMAESLSAPDTVRFKGTSGIRILDALGSRQYYITINNLRPPLNDPRVRQALNYAVAVQGIINTVFLGAARPATAVYVNPILSGYTSGGGYGYDPERARRQLEDAGWRVGAGGIREKDGKPLRLEFYAAKGLNTGDFETAELVQAMLRVIGVDARLSILEPAAFRLRITKPPDQAEYDLVLLTVGTFTGDAEYIMLTFYHTKSFAPVYYNRAYYSNPQVDEMIDRSLGVTSRAERDKIYAQVIKQVVKDAPIIMLFDTLERVAIKADVQGVYLEKAGNNWIGKYAWRGRR
jgi:ABC-type transport system substrate-binding protein